VLHDVRALLADVQEDTEPVLLDADELFETAVPSVTRFNVPAGRTGRAAGPVQVFPAPGRAAGALARIDHRTNSIEMHRLAQAVLINRMTPEEQTRMRNGAYTVLSAASHWESLLSSSLPEFLGSLTASAVIAAAGWSAKKARDWLRGRPNRDGVPRSAEPTDDTNR
jgi:hypothetical protein